MIQHNRNSIVSLSFFLAMKSKAPLTVVNLTCVCDQLTKIVKRFCFSAILNTYL